VVPIEWAYDGEDYDLAAFVDEGEDRQALEDRLLDSVMNDDEAHATFRLCLVWPKQKRTLAGVR
jgi:hypothetical protein